MRSLIEQNSLASQIEQEIKNISTTILLVDDDALILTVLEQTLQREGYKVLSARSGIEALNLLNKHNIALIICDQRMPGMSGLEILQRVQEIQPDAIRIALTGNGERDVVINAINIGQVSQFLSKPWEDIVLRQIVAESLEKYRLLQENKSLHQILVNKNRELELANQALRYDMQLGARIHEELLLGKVPQDILGLSLAATTVSTKEIDGDFFDFYHPLSHVVDVVIGDVMGKGIPAALIGTAIKMQLQRFAVPLSQVKSCDKNSFWLDDILRPQDIIFKAHEEIAHQLIELEFFVSLFYGRFDLQKKTFSYVDCGSPKPIHFRSRDGSIQFLRGMDFPVGMVVKNDYHEYATTFEDDDLFIFYSDGLTESRSPEGELFGVDRLINIVQQNACRSAEEILNIIRRSVLDFAQKGRFDDDLTLLVSRVQTKDLFKPQESLSVAYLNDLSQLNAVRGFIKRVCDNAPGDTNALRQPLELAIDEAFCNIVKHGYNGVTGQTINLRAQYQKEGLWFELSDQGKKFNPQDIPEPNLVGENENGYGLFMMRKLTDKLTYHPKEVSEGWNYLRIYKRYIFKEVPMEFNHSTQDKVLVVTPTGPSLDAREAREFKEKVIELIGQNETHSIVIDMRNLQFIDSSGLGTFLSILKTLHVQDGELKLAHLNKPIRTIFELVSMHKIFEIYNTTEEAIVSFK